jgi:hypothetical protein
MVLFHTGQKSLKLTNESKKYLRVEKTGNEIVLEFASDDPDSEKFKFHFKIYSPGG